jgi:tetratricopeptide (TPR) repeat protein
VLKRYAASVVVLALALPAPRVAVAAPPRFSRDEWVALVRAYARGERTAAVGGLGAWSERELANLLTSVEQAERAARRCPSCPRPGDPIPLKAAVMLHWDRDRADLAPPQGVEQQARCPGPVADLAARLARLVAWQTDGAGFARRFFRMAVLQSQWDACFHGAERWAGEAIELFPKDAELLLDRGSVREEMATLAPRDVEAQARREAFEKARRDFEQALAIEPALGLARIRLGRVLWQLGEPARSRQELEASLPALVSEDHAYLAHLFLGRVHQDGGRLADAIAEYRLCVALHENALSGAVALSDALLVAGDTAAARAALSQGLASAGHRRRRDPYWDYLVVNGADLQEQLETLRRETLE